MLGSEHVGSIPRDVHLLDAMTKFEKFGQPLTHTELSNLQLTATSKVVKELEMTGSSIITDGEQSKPSYSTYPFQNRGNVDPAGDVIKYYDGHGRQLPKILKRPFVYDKYAGQFVKTAKQFTELPIKQAVVSPAFLYLMYPADGIAGYNVQDFMFDAVLQAELDIRSCFAMGCDVVQIDFPEASLAMALDTTGRLLSKFITILNHLIERFTVRERSRMAVHVCSGCDLGADFCSENQYAAIFQYLFRLNLDTFYICLEKFPNKHRILSEIMTHMHPSTRIYAGIIDVRGWSIPGVSEISDRIQSISKYIPLKQLGTTDDCGFAPFADDRTVDQKTAFSLISTRIAGTRLFQRKMNLPSHESLSKL